VAAVEPLSNCVNRPDHDDRIAAARALARLQREESVPALLRTVHDPHPIVAAWAADGLGKLGDPQRTGPKQCGDYQIVRAVSRTGPAGTCRSAA
jgi:HEAT repeat protein